MKINVKKIEKNASFVEKNAKIRGVEIMKKIPFPLETIKTLEEVSRLLRLKKSKNQQNFSKKMKKFYQKICNNLSYRKNESYFMAYNFFSVFF